MLTQIKKIKNFGVFADYEGPSDLPAFSRYNIVYGENGSGKTTLTRLLGCLEVGEHPDYPSLEFSIDSQSGSLTKGTKYARKVRVFNSDYVEANIGRFEGPFRHILVLGEENKALAEELKRETTTRDARLKRIEEIEKACSKLEIERGKLFSQIAKTIGEATSGSTIRSYRKPDAESAFAKLSNAKPLTEAELEVHRATVRQEQMPAIGRISIPPVSTAKGDRLGSAIDSAEGAATRAKLLTKRTAQAVVIDRLSQIPQIALWVESGVHLHDLHSAERCEFCDQPMPAGRLKALAAHFSIEDQKLKDEIEAERRSLANLIDTIERFALPDRLALYSELRADYDSEVQHFHSARSNLIALLMIIDQELSKKLTLRMTEYEPNVGSDITQFVYAVNGIDAIFKRHDEKTAAFEKERGSARDAIEAHYLLTIKEPVSEISQNVNALNAELIALRDGSHKLDDQRSLEALSQSIAEKQAKVSNAHAGGASLSDHLKQFLGRTDLRFESGPDGYLVLRRGKPAKRLSEGEKTAIAFLYFLVQLKDQDFDISEGVVIIDDPISSLDSSAIYQAFSFLKNGAQSAKQLFILTHNFEFLRLLLNWVKNVPGPRSEKTYTMVLCTESKDGRFARLAPLDKLLIEHATEYQYLFKVLYSFKSDGTILGCYHIPNIARKVLETFLDFYVPSNKSLYQKLEETDFDPHKKTAIYKFANDLSHHTGKSFDPALVAEAQKNTLYLLEMIEAVAPLHYNGLKKMAEAA